MRRIESSGFSRNSDGESPHSSGTNAATAREKAREIIGANLGKPLLELVAIAWAQGRAELCRELKAERATHYDNTLLCRRCAARVSMPGREPIDPLTPVVCVKCSSLDERVA